MNECISGGKRVVIFAMLQMQGCSINKHMVDEVKQREKETELQMQRRKKALDDSSMDTQLKQLSNQLSECSARASAFRKVQLLLRHADPMLTDDPLGYRRRQLIAIK